MIPLLAALFPGPLAPLGAVLRCDHEMPADGLRLSSLLSSHHQLSTVLHWHARQWHTDPEDLRPVASAWSRHYLSVLLPPVLAAASLRQHVFPLAPHQVCLRLDAGGVPTSFHLAHPGFTKENASTADRYAALVWQHLSPLFDVLSTVSRLPPKVLWSNAARQIDAVLTQAVTLAMDKAPVVGDRSWLLNSVTWADAGQDQAGACARSNPLHAPRREALITQNDGTLARLRLHPQCCLYYRLPGQPHCGACPLVSRQPCPSG